MVVVVAVARLLSHRENTCVVCEAACLLESIALRVVRIQRAPLTANVQGVNVQQATTHFPTHKHIHTHRHSATHSGKHVYMCDARDTLDGRSFCCATREQPLRYIHAGLFAQAHGSAAATRRIRNNVRMRYGV